MKTRKKNALLIIDAQNDFCTPAGSLYVPGAENDMARLADFIRKNKDDIDYISLTQDSHHVIDIAHPAFWQDKNGKNPNPFTMISYKDVSDGTWTPRFAPQAAIKYIKDLEDQGEYPHVIWPEHCIIGTEGASIVKDLMNVIKEWARDLGKFYWIFVKGTNPLTEHFGAFRANIEIPNRTETQVNQELIRTLEEYDNIYFCGEAKSHCVGNTLKQAMDFPDMAKKFVILEDCMSNVPGFETLADPIFDKARQMGIRFEKSTNVKLS